MADIREFYQTKLEIVENALGGAGWRGSLN